MSCDICGNKPMNCDCAEADRRVVELEEELEEIRDIFRAFPGFYGSTDIDKFKWCDLAKEYLE